MENKTIIKSFSWKLFERFSIQGVNLLVQIILARLLLPAEFGMLTIIVAITNYLLIFVQTGLGTAIIQKEDLDKTDISTLLITSLAVALICYILLFSLAPLFARYYNMPDLISPLRVLGLVLFFNAIYSIQMALYTRDMKFKILFVISIISVLVSGGISILLAMNGWGIWSLVFQNLINVVSFVLITGLSRDFNVGFSFSFIKMKQIYKFSGQILLTSIISGLHDLIRTSVIGKNYSKESLAYYDKGLSYSWYICNISNNTLSAVLLPVFSRIQTDKNSLLSYARRSMRITSFIMFPLLFGVSAISESLITVLLTDKWSSAAIFLSIFCILRLAGCLETIDKQVYYAIGNSTINLIYEICLLVVNVVTIFLSLKKGIVVMAICAAGVEILFLFVIFLISSRVYGYSLKQRIMDIWRPLMNSIIMFFAIRSIKTLFNSVILRLLVLVSMGIVVYFFLSIITKDPSLQTIVSSFKSGRRKQDAEQ